MVRLAFGVIFVGLAITFAVVGGFMALPAHQSCVSTGAIPPPSCPSPTPDYAAIGVFLVAGLILAVLGALLVIRGFRRIDPRLSTTKSLLVNK